MQRVVSLCKGPSRQPRGSPQTSVPPRCHPGTFQLLLDGVARFPLLVQLVAQRVWDGGASRPRRGCARPEGTRNGRGTGGDGRKAGHGFPACQVRNFTARFLI